jgi:hypothetical protein
MSRRDRIRVEATIVECYRAFDEAPRAVHPWFEIVAEIETPTGDVERVTARQRLYTRTHHWRPPDPGERVAARWDPTTRDVQLALGDDARYDERLIKKLGRTRDAGSWSPIGAFPP